MSAENGRQLLTYASPVLRFLGVARVEVGFDSMDGAGGVVEVPEFIGPPHGGLPEGLASLLQHACHELLPPGWGLSNSRGRLLVDVAGGSCQLVDNASPGPEERLAFASPELPALPDRGLSSLIKGASSDANGHLVVADWLEEHVGEAPAAALRASAAARPVPREGQWLGFQSFAWRWLDRDVLLSQAHVLLWPMCRKMGHALGLLHGPPGRQRRWARWLYEGPAAEAGKRLEEELQAGRPA
jgi:hypothetical protein